MEYQVWVNGTYHPRSQATLSFMDRGLRSSDVIFDTSRTFNGSIYRLRRHIERLGRSLAYMRLDPGYSLNEIEALTLEVAARNEPLRPPGDDYFITQIITRGHGFRANLATEPTVAIWIDPITWSIFAPLYERGVHLIIPKIRAYSPDQVDPKIKHYNRLNFVLAELEVTDVDPDAFALLVDRAGNVAEAVNIGNIFIVTDGVLRTPSDRSVLQGVSRETVLELAADLAIPAREEDLQPYDVYTADEAFVTNSNHCICPVGRVDHRPIGAGVPGPVTAKLLAAWSDRVGLDVVRQIREQATRSGAVDATVTGRPA
jgi:branched-chain amino acid aminotransferase